MRRVLLRIGNQVAVLLSNFFSSQQLDEERRHLQVLRSAAAHEVFHFVDQGLVLDGVFAQVANDALAIHPKIEEFVCHFHELPVALQQHRVLSLDRMSFFCVLRWEYEVAVACWHFLSIDFSESPLELTFVVDSRSVVGSS